MALEECLLEPGLHNLHIELLDYLHIGFLLVEKNMVIVA